MLILLFLKAAKYHASAIPITTVINGHHSQAGFFFSEQNLLFALPLSQQGNSKLYDGTKNPFISINLFSVFLIV